MSAIKYLLLIPLVLCIACQSESKPDTVPDYQQLLNQEFQNAQAYSLGEAILMDLTGDGQPEEIKLQPVPDRLNLVITDGATKTPTTVLAGPGKGNYDWVDYWGIVQDSVTSKTTMVDGQVIGGTDVSLPFPAVVFRKEETGGGMIAFLDNGYQWIQQAK